MNESLDSISSFFNKLLNIKTKDQSSNSSRDQMNTLNSTNQSTNKSSSNKSSKDHQIKTTNKLTIDSLKAGLSDILDETNDYLNSIKSINLNASSSSNDLSKNTKSIEHKIEHNKEAINSNDQNKIVKHFDQIDPIDNEKSNQIDLLNKDEQNNLQSNGKNLDDIKNEKILSIDSKLNERSKIQNSQLANKDEKLNLNKNDNLNKVALNIESTNQLNSESIQQNDLTKNVCFQLNNRTNIFEEINLECVKDIKDDDVKENIQELNDVKDEKYSKINENKLITRDDSIEIAKEAEEEKQEIDKENNDLELMNQI